MSWLKTHIQVVTALVAAICVFAQKMGLPLSEKDIDHLTNLALALIGADAVERGALNFGLPPPTNGKPPEVKP